MARSAHKRIGILGGTFNPVHNGHLHLATHALKKLRLNKVIFIPAYIPPHKKIYDKVKTSDRLRMLRLAAKGKRRFAISEYEMTRKGTSYSIRTAKFLKAKFGKNAKLFFLIGADSLAGLKKWKGIDALMELLQFVAFSRPGFGMKRGLKGVIKLAIPKKNVSSEKIRRLVRKGRPIGGLVPGNVLLYIKKKGLYKK